jgi:predicted SnoaL-like aldol condensation-catalyzing enzyme
MRFISFITFSATALFIATVFGLGPGSECADLDKGPLCPCRHANELCQRQIFLDFLQTLYVEKNATKAFNTYVDIDLIEHDPFDEQGRDANAAKLSKIIPYANFTVLRSNFNNDIGVIHVRVGGDPEPAALADIYRMDGTCIVEHWDVVQDRPINATNPIAMF